MPGIAGLQDEHYIFIYGLFYYIVHVIIFSAIISGGCVQLTDVFLTSASVKVIFCYVYLFVKNSLKLLRSVTPITSIYRLSAVIQQLFAHRVR